MPNRFYYNFSIILMFSNNSTIASGSVIATITPGNSTLILAGGQQDFFFQCNVQSVEMPSILWTLTSTFSQVTRTISNAAGSLDSAYSVTFPNQQSSNLTINNVQLQNDGVYTCVATTGDLTDQASSRLSILGILYGMYVHFRGHSND